jgi:hypothetical protein
MNGIVVAGYSVSGVAFWQRLGGRHAAVDASVEILFRD